MVRVTDALALPPDQVSLYYTTDPQLSNLPIVIFHGPSTTTNSTLNSSRIQIHVFSAAGFQSYPRLTIYPQSPFYASVDHLPRDRQGDEICRGLAFGLLKYFKELPEVVKSNLISQSQQSRSKTLGPTPSYFSEKHAADIASSMVKAENIGAVIKEIEAGLRPQNITHLDVDLVLPAGSIAPLQEHLEEHMEDEESMDPTLKQHGSYAPLVKFFGEVVFLPTSKLRRAPSKQSSLNRSKSFLKDQKMSLRREMGELVDTEERYVIKMHELVNNVADEFRIKAKNRVFGSFSPSEQDLQKLFPQCLDKILQVNSGFLAAIQKVMDETEEEAMRDLEAPISSPDVSRFGGAGRLRDPTGAVAFGKILLDWFPQFSECYQEYIRASQEFPQIISGFMKQESSFSQRVQQTGEQRLRSAVIEPVQRLPRYSLFIDNIVNYLPVTHPALPSMLKARDIITAICSLDPPATDKSQVVNRLRNLVDTWPVTLCPQGRLIAAVDFVELPAPFHLGPSPLDSSREGMFLLFVDSIIIIKKARECNLSARGVMAEVDKPSVAAMMASATAAAGGQKHMNELSFCGWHQICDARFTTSDDDRIFGLMSLHELKDAGTGRDRTAPAATIRAFVLQGAYEGKASKLVEDVTKARIEGRFSESERETDKWRLRSIKLADVGINLSTAVFEEGVDSLIEGRREPAPIRIVVDHQKGTKGAPVGHYGVEVVANVAVIGAAPNYRLETRGLYDKVFVDEVATEKFLPTFGNRVAELLRSQYHISNPSLSASFISFYSKILKSIHVLTETDKSRSFRPPSPVKIISSFLNNSFGSSTSFTNSGSLNSSGPPKHPRTPLMGTIPSMQAPTIPRPSSSKSIQDFDGKGSVRATAEEGRPVNPHVRLEQTFTAYVAAVQSRKGNIIGRVLRNRGTADELAINALYNTFIENPFDDRAALEAAFDVVFVAFEKFLRLAWKDQMGQVLSLQTLDGLQQKALQLFPGDFADYVKIVLAELTPQNRRAFISIVKLLADLLDGCGNDGDRGALTAAFTELLVPEGKPHDYINLMDRMVEDSDRLFDDIGPGAVTGFVVTGNSGYGSLSTNRSNHSATGSLTSNTSSLRRRFADTLLRQNSNKADADSRPSMWRTLSKSSRNVATGELMTSSSLSKVSLNRSMSIESPGRRPVSRDRPSVLGAFDDRPSSSQDSPARLSPIGASPPPEEKEIAAKSLKKKRRSSLSDLKTLMAAASLGGNSPLPQSPGRMSQTLHKFNSSPRTPSPTKIPVAGKPMDRNRPELYSTSSPNQKENTPLNSSLRNIGNLTERPQNIMSTSDVVVVKDLWSAGKGHSKAASLSSNIPTLRGTPRDQITSALRPTGSPPKSSPQKLRLQSPQKLRERLQNEAKAINEAELSLQNELSKIGEEMAKLHAVTLVPSQDVQDLSARMMALESKIPEIIRDLTLRNDIIKKDLETSLQASEFKVKGLDQLYKESSAENELLYEKFNGELAKIVKALKGKGKEDKEDLIGKVKEASDETAKTKKENARLRREIVTLRTLLKGNE